MMLLERIHQIFAYHPSWNKATVERHNEVRKAAETMAIIIVANTPVSAEQTKAVELIREAMFYANAAIACHPSGNFADGRGDAHPNAAYVEAARLIAEAKAKRE